MPELPDVEVFKQYLDATALKKKIRNASVQSKDMLAGVSEKKLRRALRGERFRRSRRHGKYLFVQAGKGKWLVLHFGMTGFLHSFKEEEGAPPHTRMLVEFANGTFLAYDCQRKLGAIALAGAPEETIRQKELGPDALAISWKEFKRRMNDTTAAVKAALMNQSLLAGVGNIYSDETLFHASVHPAAPANKLSEKQLRGVYRQMGKVLRKAIACRVDPERFPRTCLLPHRDDPGKCPRPRCGGRLKKSKISGRSAYFCPRHQKK